MSSMADMLEGITKDAWAWPAILFASLVGCGYHLVEPRLPPGVRCVQVAGVVNDTQEPGLEVLLRRSLEDRLQALALLCSTPDAPAARLEVAVEGFDVTPSFLATGEDGRWVTGAYQVKARVVARLDTGDGQGRPAALTVQRTFPAGSVPGGAGAMTDAGTARGAWAEATEELADRIVYLLLGVGDREGE